MNHVVVVFNGGPLGGKALRTNSPDEEEQLLAAACYEMSHHGAIGGECAELSYDAAGFCRRHGWPAAKEPSPHAVCRYSVTERRETEKAIVVKFTYHPA